MLRSDSIAPRPGQLKRSRTVPSETVLAGNTFSLAIAVNTAAAALLVTLEVGGMSGLLTFLTLVGLPGRMESP